MAGWASTTRRLRRSSGNEARLDEARSFIQARVPAVRAFLRRRTALKNADYRALIGVTRHAATRELKRLVQEGYLRMEGTRRGSRYLPGPTLVRGEEWRT
jgi:Fic family protein